MISPSIENVQSRWTHLWIPFPGIKLLEGELKVCPFTKEQTLFIRPCTRIWTQVMRRDHTTHWRHPHIGSNQNALTVSLTVLLTFISVDKVVLPFNCDYSNEICWVVFSYCSVYHALRGDSNFRVASWNFDQIFRLKDYPIRVPASLVFQVKWHIHQSKPDKEAFKVCLLKLGGYCNFNTSTYCKLEKGNGKKIPQKRINVSSFPVRFNFFLELCFRQLRPPLSRRATQVSSGELVN